MTITIGVSVLRSPRRPYLVGNLAVYLKANLRSLIPNGTPLATEIMVTY